jgi:hypothetical protein
MKLTVYPAVKSNKAVPRNADRAQSKRSHWGSMLSPRASSVARNPRHRISFGCWLKHGPLPDRSARRPNFPVCVRSLPAPRGGKGQPKRTRRETRLERSYLSPTREVTALLRAWRERDETSLEALMPLVHDERRRIFLRRAQLSSTRRGVNGCYSWKSLTVSQLQAFGRSQLCNPIGCLAPNVSFTF